MILIERTLLATLTQEASLGVPVATLTKKHNLPITAPTLSKMISHMNALNQSENPQVKALIEKSLFPEWARFTSEDRLIKQSMMYNYNGLFPLGQWVKI